MGPAPVETPVAAVERLHAPAPPGLRPHPKSTLAHALAEQIEVAVARSPRLDRPVLLPGHPLGDRLMPIGVELPQHLRHRAPPAAVVRPVLQAGPPRGPGTPRRQLGAALPPIERLGHLHEPAMIRGAGTVGERARGAGRNRASRARRGSGGNRDRIDACADEPRHQMLAAAEHQADGLQTASAARRAPPDQPRRHRRRDPPAAGPGELHHPLETLGAAAENAADGAARRSSDDAPIGIRRLGDDRPLAHALQPRPSLETQGLAGQVAVRRHLRRNAADTRVDLDAARGRVTALDLRRSGRARPGPESGPTAGERRLVPFRRRRLLAAARQMAVAQIRRERPQRRPARRHPPGIPDVRAELHQDRIAAHRLQARLPERRLLDQLTHPGERSRPPRRSDHQGRLGDVPHHERPRAPHELGSRVTHGDLGRIARRLHWRIRDRRDQPPAAAIEAGPAAQRAVHGLDRLAARRIDLLAELGASAIDGAPHRLRTGHGRMRGPGIRTQLVLRPEGLPHLVHYAGASRFDLPPQRLPPRLELLLDPPGDDGRIPLAVEPGEPAIEVRNQLLHHIVEAVDDVLADDPVGLVARPREPLRQTVAAVVMAAPRRLRLTRSIPAPRPTVVHGRPGRPIGRARPRAGFRLRRHRTPLGSIRTCLNRPRRTEWRRLIRAENAGDALIRALPTHPLPARAGLRHRHQPLTPPARAARTRTRRPLPRRSRPRAPTTTGPGRRSWRTPATCPPTPRPR